MPSRLDRAHDAHENHMDNRVRAEITGMRGWFTGPGYVMSERRKNFKKQMKDAPTVGEIVRVSVGETADTHEQTIQLTDVDGRSYILWLTHSGHVRSVTPY